ncbi:hypothetical protein NADFUDRAFT_68979 [Nadsonia fulvescens var. elongata DSM 6958]|uniref:Ubiquitin thioesterase OTU n=1 Tax=Nadsonia fulvescens var. elongata DSM 6958 TaxID=857566 RepID=A0A1E3PQ70_9ASCO|nr:hypothetical protein NADFUDRAFT_68979 [Nadsonia fulvescens var. elongata DSM 6958]
MRLKIMMPSSLAHVVNLDNTTTAEDLKAHILSLDELGETSFSVRGGFPPRHIELEGTTLLKQLGIQNGDKLTVVSNSSNISVSSTEELILRIMADDNSCLFRAVGHAIFQNSELASELRSVVAQTIANNSVDYSDAILGQPRGRYMSWIQRATSWGGAIELTILATHFGLTIASLDVASGRVDRFNPGMDTFCVVVYSGIHYDSVAIVSPGQDQDLSKDRTVFEIKTPLGERILEGLSQLRQQLKWRHYYTDTARFAIKCLECHTVFHGQAAAAKHAKATNHGKFGEVAN